MKQKKYTITIEFVTDEPLVFPIVHVVVGTMEAQLESLSDGDHGKAYDYKVVGTNFKEEEYG